MKLRPGLCLPPKYVEQERAETVQYDDHQSDGLCQLAAYKHAVRRCKVLGLRSITDLGCGSAAKMVPLTRRFAVTLVDLPATIDRLRHLEGIVDLVEHDFEAEPLGPKAVSAAIFCMDVVEHLRNPEHLLATIRTHLAKSSTRAFISSPCRTHCPGISKKGPPANKSHVREWTCEEFAELLGDAGLDVLEVTHHAERPGVEGKGTMLFEVVDGS